jgi:Alanine-zipper, major outer membrane lipoprotein
MKKATILGSIALLALVTALLAAPALSSPNRQEITIRGLARQVNALKREVRTLRGQVRAARTVANSAQATANSAQATANSAQATANTAQSTAQKLDGCLSRALPVTRYGDFVWSTSETLFTDYDPDVLGYVPNIDAGIFGLAPALDVTNTGSPVSYYLAIVEPGCAGGFRIAERTAAVER